MIEIENKIYDLMEQDAALRLLTGHLASDTRIYHDWPPEELPLSLAKPAYITMHFSAPGPIVASEEVQPVQFPDMAVELNVWANTPLLRDQVHERLMEIFWSRADTTDKWTEIWTTNYRIMKVTQEMAESLTEIHEGTGQVLCWRKIIRLRLGAIYKDR